MMAADIAIARLSPMVQEAIAALLLLFPGSRPDWRQVRQLCAIRNTPEEPVAAAFGYLRHHHGYDPATYGYMDALSDEKPPGAIDYALRNHEINAAFEYFLLRHPETKRRWYHRSSPA